MGQRHRWLLLMHQLPPQPDYFRVKVWRRLRAIGAATVKNSVYVLPNTPDAREDFEWLIREIAAGGGEAVLCEATFVAGLSDEDIGSLLQQRGQNRDVDAQAAATQAVAELATRTRSAPRGAIWVTRRDFHADRISSAWLIRRFIDPAARFRFVSTTDRMHANGELRFDMFEAEYTHVGDACTFEVLLDAFDLRSITGLSPIAEIVHDIDCKDEKFGRAETAETARALNELYSSHASDAERLDHGAMLFENLFGLFGEEAP